MKLFFRAFLPILIGLSSLQAQTGEGIFKKDTLKILAIMVDFQTDKYDATIGTGKFGSHYTKDYKDTIVDPLPHNDKYFEDHLLFAQNYFKSVSNGKLNLKYTVLPEVITVSKMMREYSTPYKSKDLTPVANLSKESWELAYQKYPGINYSGYDLFIIFHAGVSNSLNTGSYEINRNLPAIYLGEKSLKEIYGTGFSGLINAGGTKIIKNSIIMPETESREITAIDDSKALLQISINGELVANIGSFLGLPDLYNTETGISAIGRFGLMDGQSMVANLGIFPPEPSAWEKIYLGWVTPAVATIKSIRAGISTQKSALPSDTTILKIPINDYEYFLVENRQQDVLKDGIKLTYKKGNEIFTDILQPDSTGLFTFMEADIKGGNVISVDDYDAALPGNGIVIWHIDEKIINERITAGGINNDKLRKGVSVVEADGITDIGEVVNSIFGDIIGEGLVEDFWFSGNGTKYFKNKFADDTKPSTKSNSGANSFITMENFSSIAPKMTFDLSFGGTVLTKTLVKLNLAQAPSSLITVKELGNHFNYIIAGSDLQKYSADGILLKTISGFSEFKPISFTINDTLYYAGVKGQVFKLWNTSNDKIFTYNLFAKASAPLVFRSLPNGVNEILIGIETGVIVRFNVLPESYLSDSLFNLYVPFNMGNKIIQLSGTDDYLSAVTETGFSDSRGYNIAIPYKVKCAALTKDKAGNFINVVLSEGNRFYIISNDIILSEFRISETGEISKFILADILNDGENSIIFTIADKLYAVNQKGVVADNYPLTLPVNDTFLPGVYSFKYDDDNSADFVVSTNSGGIYFVNGRNGRIIKELSLSTGSKVKFMNLHAIDNSPFFPMYDDLAVTAITENNTLYTWDLQMPSTKMIWYSEFGNYLNNSFLPQSLNTVSFDKLLPEGKVYNWPNPVYGTETNIRFNVNEDSKVTIKIFDMGGQIAAEMEKDAPQNMDTEVVWNVKDVKSGVYFARIEAVSKTGKSEYKIVKIVVIK